MPATSGEPGASHERRGRGLPRATRHVPGLVPHPLFAAVLALAWLVLQTGRKPSRITYPCQQAAMHAAWVALGIALAPAILRLAARVTRRGTRLAAVSTTVTVLVCGGLSDTTSGHVTPHRATRSGAADHATVFVADNTGGSTGDHHRGIDRLLAGMGREGLRFFRSAVAGPEAGPGGIVGAADIVLIKVNQQWSERGGTNTDVLKGLIVRILEHPDGFRGEVVVVENGQGRGNLDWPASNAEDRGQSVKDVVDGFARRGLPVSSYLWDRIRTTSVGEYAAGDMNDGYVLDAFDPDTDVRVSYPKFRTAGGSFVSLKHGVWNSATSGFDGARLKFLAVAVLKCHGQYGVTGAVKLHVGTMTTGLGTNTHDAVASGGLGSFLAGVRMPDLNILDCIYVLADPGGGPDAAYADASRVDALLAGQDPVALDLWGTARVLVPAMRANGHPDFPEQDPQNPSGSFRSYLDATALRLRSSGIPVVTDLGNVTAVVCSAAAGTPPEPPVALGACPNPFVSSTVVRFRPRRPGATRLAIYDLAGRLRRSIPVFVQAGETAQVGWDGTDDDGRSLGAGSYYYRVSGAGDAMSGRMTILR